MTRVTFYSHGGQNKNQNSPACQKPGGASTVFRTANSCCAYFDVGRLAGRPGPARFELNSYGEYCRNEKKKEPWPWSICIFVFLNGNNTDIMRIRARHVCEYYGTRMRIAEWNRAENRADIARAIPLRPARQFDPVLLPVSLLSPDGPLFTRYPRPRPSSLSRLLDFHASHKCEFYE